MVFYYGLRIFSIFLCLRDRKLNIIGIRIKTKRHFGACFSLCESGINIFYCFGIILGAKQLIKAIINRLIKNKIIIWPSPSVFVCVWYPLSVPGVFLLSPPLHVHQLQKPSAWWSVWGFSSHSLSQTLQNIKFPEPLRLFKDEQNSSYQQKNDNQVSTETISSWICKTLWWFWQISLLPLSQSVCNITGPVVKPVHVQEVTLPFQEFQSREDRRTELWSDLIRTGRGFFYYELSCKQSKV